MRQMIFLSLMVVALVTTNTAFAAHGGKLVLGTNGEVKVKVEHSIKWTETDILVSHEAAEFPNAVSEAYHMPGTPVPVETHTRHEHDGLWHIVKKTVATKAVVYDAGAKTVKTVALDYDSVIEEIRRFNPFLLFAGTLLTFMLVSSIFFSTSRREVGSFTIVTHIAAYVATCSAILASIFAAIAAAAVGAFIALGFVSVAIDAVVVAIVVENSRVKRASAIYFIVATASVILFLTGI